MKMYEKEVRTGGSADLCGLPYYMKRMSDLVRLRPCHHLSCIDEFMSTVGVKAWMTS